MKQILVCYVMRNWRKLLSHSTQCYYLEEIFNMRVPPILNYITDFSYPYPPNRFHWLMMFLFTCIIKYTCIWHRLTAFKNDALQLTTSSTNADTPMTARKPNLSRHLYGWQKRKSSNLTCVLVTRRTLEYVGLGLGLGWCFYTQWLITNNSSSLINHHSSLITYHSSLITQHTSLITHHLSFITHHSSLITFHSSLIITITLSN